MSGSPASQPRSAQAFARACRVIPGGVNSPARAFGAVGGEPPFMERAEGQFLFDIDGHRYIDYAFKNAGATNCSLRGYPTVVLLDKQGHVIHSAHAKVVHSPVSPIRTVVIGSGKRAFFTFMWGDGAFCPGRAFTFYSLRVSPPNNAIGFRPVLGKTPACDAFTTVSAVRPKRLPF